MADFNTSIKMKGTEPELLSLLKTIRMYAVDKREQYCAKEDCPYLDGTRIENSGGKRVECLSEDELLDVIKSSEGQISIEAYGPYGVFGFLNEVCLFEKMADAAPSAWFEGLMSGFGAGGYEAVKAELENGLLKLFNCYPKLDAWSEDDEDDEDYDDEEMDYSEMSLSELKAECKDRGLKVTNDMDEDDLIEMLEDDDDDDEWDDESVYIPVPVIDNRAMYVAKKINKGHTTIVFEKHNFAISDSCSEKNTIIKEIESRGGRIRKNVGKTTHYIVLGRNIKGNDPMSVAAIELNNQENMNIWAITEDELFTLFK